MTIHGKGTGNREKLQRLRLGGAWCLRGCEQPPPEPCPAPSCLQENQGSALADSGSPRDSPAHEVVISSRGAYVRFDAPRPRAPWSWSSFRGGGRAPGSGRAALQPLWPRHPSPPVCTCGACAGWQWTGAVVLPLTPSPPHSPAAAPLRGGPRHLGRHAVHRCDLLHHAVPVPGPRVGDPALRPGRVAAHPRHGSVQPLRLRGQGGPPSPPHPRVGGRARGRHRWGSRPPRPPWEPWVAPGEGQAFLRMHVAPGCRGRKPAMAPSPDHSHRGWPRWAPGQPWSVICVQGAGASSRLPTLYSLVNGSPTAQVHTPAVPQRGRGPGK